MKLYRFDDRAEPHNPVILERAGWCSRFYYWCMQRLGRLTPDYVEIHSDRGLVAFVDESSMTRYVRVGVPLYTTNRKFRDWRKQSWFPFYELAATTTSPSRVWRRFDLAAAILLTLRQPDDLAFLMNKFFSEDGLPWEVHLIDDPDARAVAAQSCRAVLDYLDSVDRA